MAEETKEPFTLEEGTFLSMPAEEMAGLELAEENWVIEPLLPRGGRLLLYGDTGIGKSQVALTAALSVSEGEPFLEQFHTVQGRVVYIQADMVITEWQDRLQRLRGRMGGIHSIFYPDAFDIELEARMGENSLLRREIRAQEPVLVVVDVLSMTHVQDENDNQIVRDIYSAWKQVVGLNCGIIFVHHEKKPYEGMVAKHHYSGAKNWLGFSSSSLRLYTKKGKMFLSSPKTRNAANLDTIPLERDSETLLVQESAPAVEKKLQEMMESGMPKSEIVSEVTDMSKWRPALTRRTAYRRLKGYGE